MTDQRLHYVLSSKRTVGFLLSCAKGWKAYDRDGRPIGLWPDEGSVAKAVYKQAAAVFNAE